MTPAPGLYVGTIRHRRFAPRPHAFTYPLFMALLDIDRVREAMAVSHWLGYNRWNWASFDDRDHPRAAGRSLREHVEARAREAGDRLPDGPVYLLTQLRYCGYVFNPISFFYCYDRGGRLRRTLADVRNTYGGRHAYWLTPGDDASRRFLATAIKSLEVSPFMTADARYRFTLLPPGPALVAHIDVEGLDAASGPRRLFDATLTLRRRPWTPAAVRSTLLRFPLMTARVTAAIYWEALRLRLKGVPAHAIGASR